MSDLEILPNGLRSATCPPHTNTGSVEQPKTSIGPPFDALYNREPPYQCLIGIDIGTSKIEVAYALSPVGNPRPMNLSTKKLELQKSASQIPSLVAVVPCVQNSKSRGVFSFGRDVEVHLENDFIRPEHVFSNLKQCSCLMDARDLVHQQRRDALCKTQQKHDIALKYSQEFEEVELRLPRGKTEIYYRRPEPGSHQKRFESVEDILEIMFLWLIDTIKASFGSLIRVDDLEIDRLFKSNKIRIGVAVPDVLPQSAVAKYYEMLVHGGFDEKVQMLSESRSAAAKVSQDIFMSPDSANTTGIWAHEDVDIDVCDIGHGTTDISTLRAVKNSGALRFTFPVESKGDATGGKVIEDHILEFLREKFRGHLGEKIDLDVFVEHFRSGIANSKKDFRTSDQKIFIRYAGPERLSQFATVEGIEVRGQTVAVPASVLKEAYDTFLGPITNISNGTKSKRGLLERHYSEIARVDSWNKRRLIYLVGGAAIAEYTQERVQSALSRLSPATNLAFSYRPSSQNAYVAEGAVLMLADEELGKRRYHNESIGCIADIPGDMNENPRDRSNRVDWFFMVGQKVGDSPEVTRQYDYEIEVNEGEDPTRAEFAYPLDFEWPVARTTDECVGREQHPFGTNKEIKTERGIVHPMDRKLCCDFIGWQRPRVKDEPWRLSFQIKVRLNLVGNRICCEITIPANGKFADGIPTERFEVSVSANVSHMVQEDMFEERSKITQRATVSSIEDTRMDNVEYLDDVDNASATEEFDDGDDEKKDPSYVP